MIIVFGAGHVDGAKYYMGYTEDTAMLDLAQRKAAYAETYQDIKAYVMNVRAIASYQGIEDFIKPLDADLCSLEHSNADDSIDEEPHEPNRVVVYRTVRNPGDGCCRVIGQTCADILQTTLADIRHRYNDSKTGDYYGAIGRAMKAGCSDAWLIEHGFHTHAATREKLSDPAVRQELAEKEVDAMAGYYGWTKEGDTMLKIGDKGLAVTYWQNSILKRDEGALPLYGANGEFNDETAYATGAFQMGMGLPVTSIVDTDTFAYMCNFLLGITNPNLAIMAELGAANTKIDELTADLVTTHNLLIVEQSEKDKYIQSDASKAADLHALSQAIKVLRDLADKYPS